MKIVLDTNVLVSALLSPFGVPSQLVRLVLSGTIPIALDERIFAEYQDVLARPHFNFRQDRVQRLLEYIADKGEFVVAPPLHIELPDNDDLCFVEVAVATKSTALVTGNQKHFPKRELRRFNLNIISPAEFLMLL